jgi:enolase-phosphatase E1
MLWMMDRDRKTQGLKRLQGQIWRAGYEQGTLESDVFDDVPVALRKWRSEGARIFIYSSGSVAAQRLLFRYSRCGDLTGLIDGYFDTAVGEKRSEASYARILAEVGAEGTQVLFLTDIVAEADAAAAAGMRVCIAERPGNATQPAHGYAVSSRFDLL